MTAELRRRLQLTAVAAVIVAASGVAGSPACRRDACPLADCSGGEITVDARSYVAAHHLRGVSAVVCLGDTCRPAPRQGEAGLFAVPLRTAGPPDDLDPPGALVFDRDDTIDVRLSAGGDRVHRAAATADDADVRSHSPNGDRCEPTCCRVRLYVDADGRLGRPPRQA